MTTEHDEDDDDFGQKLPPLHIYLKRVLDKYPEGGQILKELVQNADDAGARRVVILHDKVQHPTNSMWSDSLHDFNGPSLFVYNDATFQEPDWKNIQHPEQSGKIDDPTKVGRFGLGFISVYHMTDIPSILSGTQIGFLDPHEKYFVFDPHTRVKHKGKRGKKWRLSAEILDKFPDQFNPYMEPLFNCTRQSFESGSFKGTIFRFPLRNSTESQVSKAVYDDQRVQSLFQSYQADAEISLLFLKNVESVTLYEKTGTTETPKLVFKVEVSEASRQNLRREREQFLQTIMQPIDIKAICRMDITKEVQNGHGIQTSCNKYITMNIVKRDGISNSLRELATDKDLGLLPWVGVSMLVNGNKTDNGDGRVFCFLPLPESERTGLPIHVHGYFGLGDNRRSIKWPDRESEHDKSAQWNKLLVHDVFPDAYKSLILNAISQGSSAKDMYKSWPDVSNLNPQWTEGVKRFLSKISNESVLYTNAEGLKGWKKPVEVFVDPLNDDLIQTLLERKGLPVARIPENVRRCLEWGDIKTNAVTPAIVRESIRGDPLSWMNREDKLRVLQYILQDGCFIALYQQQIHLLPLADDSFTLFTSGSSSTSRIYIANDEIPQDLFPHMCSRFLAKDAPPDLHKAVGYTQLTQLRANMVPNVLKEALPRDWIQGNNIVHWSPGGHQQPDMQWMERIWNWLTVHASSVPLTTLSSVSLIPLDVRTGNCRLGRIRIHQMILKTSGSTLPESMCTYLESLGAIVLRDNLPYWLAQHPQIYTFIQRPDVNGFMEVLQSCWNTNAITNIGTGGDVLRKDIRNFFAHATLHDHYKRLLCQLPIFNTTDGSQASVNQVKHTVPNGFHGIPVQRLRQRFLLESDDSDRLAINLGACRVSESALLSQHILPDVENGFYNSDEITRIMLWVLDRPTYDAHVKILKFVPTGERVCRPTELFTPDDQCLMTLFRNKPVFPTGVYASGRPLQCLKRLGLRDLSSVNAEEVLMVSVDVSQSHDYDKARALLNHITDYPHLLGEAVNMNRISKPLGKFLRDKAWVPCEKDRPNDYPNTLKWCGNDVTLCRPDEAAIFDDWAFLLGSIKPMVKVQRKIPEFQVFDWESPNPNKYHIVEQVIRNLTNASSCTQDPRYVRNMTTLVDAIYGFLNQVPSQYLEQIVCNVRNPLVWHGSGFTTADKIAFSKGTISVNLAPYLHVLPPAIAQYRSLLTAIGVKEQFSETALNDVLQIVQAKYQQHSDTDFSTDLKLVCDILNSIIAFATPDCSFSNVLVPCRRSQNDPENVLTMTTSSECLYVDEERLLVEYNHSDCGLPVVHEMIPNQTAKRLGLRPLSHSVAPVENIDLGYDIEGPHQSTVNAIKRNLDMYKEGLDIFKELIQNADDAGATEVKFLIDWRDNSANRSSLMNDGMQMCHGPALWAYNNATFSDNDVKNICSIAAASKKDQLDKIGRFGLGFTSVYHITDVPSLVSGPFVLIFDPRTNHLGNRINPGRPGIKLDLRNESHRRTVKSYPDQFQPFQGIFNCDLSPTSNGFDKTLFRLPLRTHREADDVSEEFLTKSVYNSKDEMTKMVMALKESAPSLLLFTQNVTNVSIQNLPSNGSSTNQSDYETLLEISAETIKTLPRCIDRQENNNAQRKILHATQAYMRTPSLPVPETTTVIKVTSKAMVTKKTGKKAQKTTEHMFVVSSCMVTGRLLEMAKSSEGKKAGVLPCGGVAVQLGSGKEGRIPIAFGNNGTSGGAFSYLPLDVDTGLPFHVNGNFLLQPNRRQLWSKSSSAAKVKQGGEFETKWNIGFMEDVICKATVNLLEDLQFLQSEDFLDARDFQLLWPRLTHAESDFYPVVHSFYKYLCNPNGTKSANLIYNGNRWVCICSCFFMEGSICSEPVGNAIQSVLNQHLHPKKLITLHEDVLQTIGKVDVGDCLREKTYNLGRFLREVYFEKIEKEEEIPKQDQKSIMLHLLDLRIGPEKKTEFDPKLQTLECFPASPIGEELASPDRLIHPDKPIGQLFKEEDGRFPYGKEYRREERLLSLSELGMATQHLGWDDIIDRAESFTTDDSYEKQIQKCVILLRLMDKQLLKNKIPDSSQKERLRNAQFLPVLTKPYNYPMEWKKANSPFMAAAELYTDENKYLVGSIHSLFDGKCLGVDGPSQRVKSLLGIGSRVPQVDDVVKQLRKVVNQVTPVKAVNICNEIYTFLNNLVVQNDRSEDKIDTDNWMEELKAFGFVLVESRFLRCDQLAFNCNRRGGHYLYAVPVTLSGYKSLLSTCGVKETFSFDDYVNVLQILKQNNTSEALSETDVSIAEDMLRAIVSLAESDDYSRDRVLALDSQNILRPISDLTYNDMSWLDLKTVKEEVHFTHKSITITEARDLEIITLTQIHLTNCSSRQGFQTQFGQKEELTTRLNGILRGYSHTADVLKELLQNADDAGATEMHIVYDSRKHKGTKIVGPSWETMHTSPAICVYNNKPFTDSDIEGIQNVGVGGKTSDAATTGRFGIGFNSVYHLTDCPTFLSNNQKLCVFDPHVKYIPDATNSNPGMLYSLQGPNGCLATFPDMISGYLSEFEEFDLQKGTMFRFPLRNSAHKSAISSETYNDDKVQSLFQEFEQVARESILFLNSVQKISISEIDEKSQSLKTKFWIKVEVSEEAIQYRNDLRDLSKSFQSSVDKSFLGISQRNWVYDMTIEDSDNRLETWLISQSFGGDEFNEDQEEAFNFKTKGYLPRGGVAALLQARRSTKDINNPYQRRYKAFTFLPLPITTKLPVHVNGTFELDQLRRNLVKGNEYGKSEQGENNLIHIWNRLLAEHVIGPAYAKLIHIAGRKLIDTKLGTKKEIHHKLTFFNRLFPDNLSDLTGEWELIARSMLMYIGNNSLDVLPVIKTSNDAEISVTWHHPVSEKSEAFFDNLANQLPEKETAQSATSPTISRSDALKSFLLEIGFNLVSMPITVCKCFVDAGVAAELISPHAVLNYLAAHSEQIADTFPCKVEDTRFHNPKTLQVTLEYCLSEAKEPSDLNGLPFRLTRDRVLAKLSFDNTVYVTHFAHILPRVPQLFIHPALVNSFMEWISDDTRKQLCFSSGIFKEFTLTELELHLHEHLPNDWKNCPHHIKWSPGNNQHPSQEWLRNLWKFISNRCSSDGKELNALCDWAVYPTICGRVASPRISRTILFLDKYSDSSIRESVSKILKKLCTCLSMSRMTLESGDLSDALLKIIESQLAVPTNQSNVLLAIRHMMDVEQSKMEQSLSNDECDTLLRYFQEGCEQGNDLSRDDIQTLKRLPIFQVVNGDQMKAINDISNCHTISSFSLPKTMKKGLTSILSTANCILLRHNKMLELLYKKLGITPITKTEIFLKYILPNFDELDDETKLHYIKYIKDEVIRPASEKDNQLLYSALKSIPFIKDINGRNHTADYFYDPTNKVFKYMIPEAKLLPQKFVSYDWTFSYEWMPFLKQIGLKDEVTRDMFITFCRQIENKATVVNREDDYNRLVEQSKILVEDLKSSKLLGDSTFLRNIAGIKFIPSIRIEKELREIHPPFISEQNHAFEPFIAYKGAVPSKYKELAWSVAMILPAWAIPQEEYMILDSNGYSIVDKVKVHKCLEIENDIIMSKVLQHIQRVCDHVAARNAVEQLDTLGPTVRLKLMSVLKTMMRHIKYNLPKHADDIKRSLYHTPICPVEEGVVLVTANKLIFDIADSNASKMRPYLFKVPRDLSDFDHVFRVLGAEQRVTFDQLAGVLSEIKESCDSSGNKHEQMHPEEQKVSHVAVRNLFSLLKETEGKCPISVTRLILPTPEDRLKPSTDLYFTDDTEINLTATEVELVVPLKQCGIEIEKFESDLINLLPQHLRPHNIQEMMIEKPCETNEKCPRGDDCPFLKHIKNIITSEEMQRVLLRLLRHQSQDKKTCEKRKKQIEQLLHFENMECIVELKTGQYDKGGKLLYPRKWSRDVFIQTTYQDEASFKLLLEHQDSQKPYSKSLFRPLAYKINTICSLKLDDSHIGYLREVVECRIVNEMNDCLSKLGIPEFDAIDQRNQPDRAKPGMIVPKDIRHMLDDDPYNKFRQDETVVYKSPIEDIDVRNDIGSKVPDEDEYYFVYAKLLEEVSEDGASPLQRKYRIDVGKPNPIVVSILKLFKFRRPRKQTETTVAIFEGDPESAAPPTAEHSKPPPRDLEEAKKRIREAVREVFTLPESEQKIAIRRLYRMWHPDKNRPEESVLYNEAFKFLKELLVRKGKEDTKEDTSSSSFRDFASRYESWESDIRREREQERAYQERYQDEFGSNTSNRGSRRRRRNHQSSGNSYVPPSFSSSTPDPQNARKWYRQAEEELDKTREQVHSGANTPWRTAFYLHQVVEIALKAAKYYQDGKPDKACTDLVVLARGLVINISGNIGQGLVEKVIKLIRLGVDFHKPRYPDNTSSSMQKYADFDEEGCVQICTEILHEVRDMIGIRPF